ncbi:MAG: cell division protein CrgA [Micrococcales bacterium]
MPESSSRKKKSDKPTSGDPRSWNPKELDNPNPVWFAPVMFGFMLLGLAWIIMYYVTSAQLPLGSAFGDTSPFNIGNWNIAVGFGIAMVGFIMSTKWK